LQIKEAVHSKQMEIELKKRQNVQKSVQEREEQNVEETVEEGVVRQNNIKECDGIYVCNSTDSIGTTIKRSAIELHYKLLNNEKLSVRQRKIMMKYQYMLTKPASKKVTENDYLRCIWSPLFETIFLHEANRIRIKSGESINSASTNNKKRAIHPVKICKILQNRFQIIN
jgi:hypothetical protein